MKLITFLGDSLARLKEFPADARSEAGFQLREIQKGREPADWKPMKTVGPGVKELRIREARGSYRVMYLATLPDRVLILHAFAKRTEKTPQRDIELASQRLRSWTN